MASIDEKLAEAGYRAVIGLEVHVQLNTESKIFAPDANDFEGAPNTHVSPVSLGHPGSLPVLNQEVLHKAIRMGLACDSEISRENHFARKNYFYPDLPKGYQITQDKTPICVGGKVKLIGDVGEKEYVQLHHIHLEEDAGKSIHDQGSDTLIDLNRAGTPLIEIVTDPDMAKSSEAAAFLQEVRRLVRYLEISGGNMENGELRCDANISIMPVNSRQLGNKVEVKNMNSINNVRKAIDHEIERQLGLASKGEDIVIETRTFDTATGTTAGMRFKETMNDYRYFPDPDLPPVLISEEMLQGIFEQMPALPVTWRTKFIGEYGLKAYDVELLTEEKETALYFNALCEKGHSPKSVANWMNGPVKGLLNETGKELSDLDQDRLGELVQLVADEKVSFSIAAQRILPELMKTDESAEQIAERLNLIIHHNTEELTELVRDVLVSLPDKVEAFKKGKKNLMGLFMGQVMKKSGGKVNPKTVQKVIIEEINR